MSAPEPTTPLALRLAALLVPREVREEVLGDLLEVWFSVAQTRGRFGRTVWVWRQPLSLLLAQLRWGASGLERWVTAPVLRSFGALSLVDVKLGLRMMLRHPGLTTVSVLSMSMAVAFAAGFTSFSANFSAPPLPLQDGDRVVALQYWDASAQAPEPRILHAFDAWQKQLVSVTELGAFKLAAQNLVLGSGQSAFVQGSEVTSSTFRIARVPPLLGRVLLPSDEDEGAPDVAVLGYALWSEILGGDPGVLGTRILLDGTVREIVGVMPPDFRFPYANDLWVPLREDPLRWEAFQGPALFVFGRLADGASIMEAQAEVAAIGRLDATGDNDNRGTLRPRVLPYTAAFMAAPGAVVIGGRMTLALLLVVICASVGTLLTARNTTRTAELAIRAALGAGRKRIVAQFFLESVVLTSVAGALGLILTVLGLRYAERLAADQIFGSGLPFWWRGGLAPNTVSYVIGFAFLAAVVAGALPALRVSSGPVSPRLQRGSRSGIGVSGRLPRWAIPAQVAFSIAAMTLVIGQIPHSLTRAIDVPGLAAEEFLTAELRMGGGPHFSSDSVQLLARYSAARKELADRLLASPEVDAVVFATALPGTMHRQQRVEVEDHPGAGRNLPVRVASIEADFFAAMGVQPIRGRVFDSRDIDTNGRARPVAIVNESFALTRFGTEAAVGGRMRAVYREREAGPWLEVVGVVPDFGMNLDETSHPEGYYQPLADNAYPVSVAVHAGSGAVRVRSLLQSAGIDADPALSLVSVRSAESIITAARLRERVPFFGIAIPTLVALLLALSGVHALVSFAVSRRTHEIGIRLALGARPRGVALEVLSASLKQVVIGVVVGLAVTVVLSQTIYAADDLRLVAWATLVVVAAGMLACAAPTWRAVTIQPAEAFREVA